MDKTSLPERIEPAESIERTETTLRPRVAQYVRMSADHQQHSPQSQSDLIRLYAEAHNMEIVGTYSDQDRATLGGVG